MDQKKLSYDSEFTRIWTKSVHIRGQKQKGAHYESCEDGIQKPTNHKMVLESYEDG